MHNVTFFEVTNPMKNEVVEHAVIDHGNNQFTSMSKAEYDKQLEESSN